MAHISYQKSVLPLFFLKERIKVVCLDFHCYSFCLLKAQTLFSGGGGGVMVKSNKDWMDFEIF